MKLAFRSEVSRNFRTSYGIHSKLVISTAMLCIVISMRSGRHTTAAEGEAVKKSNQGDFLIERRSYRISIKKASPHKMACSK